MPTPVENLRSIAAGQDSQFATAQALELGVTRDELKGLRRRGETDLLRRGVSRFRSGYGPADAAVTAMLACWPDGVISHRSAAQFHGIKRVAPPTEPEVTVPHGVVRKLPGIKVHWSRSIPANDVLKVGGVRYMSLARTVVDLADPDEPWESLSVLDDAVAMGARRAWVHQRATALANGRGGVTLIRDATAPGAANPFNSWLERASAELYRAAGLPEPQWNVPVHDHRGRIGVVDAFWPEWRVVSEKEGLRFHTTPSQRRRDADRFNRLLDADYRARRFTWEDVVHRPLYVVETLYRVLGRAGAPLDRARMPREIAVPTQPFLFNPRARA